MRDKVDWFVDNYLTHDFRDRGVQPSAVLKDSIWEAVKILEIPVEKDGKDIRNLIQKIVCTFPPDSIPDNPQELVAIISESEEFSRP